MLKKIEPSKKKYFNKKSRTFFKSFPKSNKVYINGKIYKDLKVGMRHLLKRIHIRFFTTASITENF